MDRYAYYNGQFDKFDKIKIPLSDRSVFFGDCIYDAAIGRYDRILWEDEHIQRFFGNANKLGIRHNLTRKRLSALLHEIAIKSGIEYYFMYFSLSRRSENRVHSAAGCNTSNLLITVEPMKIQEKNEPLRLITQEDKRYDYCDIKTINLLPAVIASTNAEKAACDEAVFYRNGIVTECAKSNIFIINQGRIKTHPISSRILAGITRAHLLKTSRGLGIPCDEIPFSVEDMLSADEILVTSTSKLCRRVGIIDGISVGGGAPDLAQNICDKIYAEYVDFC